MQNRIVVTNRIHDDVAARLAAAGEVDLNAGDAPLDRNTLTKKLGRATAMMGFMTDCVDRATLAQAPHLRVVAYALKGFDSYDVNACTDAGVWISIVPDLLTEPTAELAVGLAIALARQIRSADQYVRDGRFAGWRPLFYGTGLADSIVTIVGLGKVGRAIAARLQGFGCRMLGVDPEHKVIEGVESAELSAALKVSDYVFLAVPLTKSTHHLIGSSAFRLAKSRSLWINVGRGSVIDEEAIAESLAAGHIGGYAADVFAFEDWLLPDRPSTIPRRLLDHPNTLFTPHIGSAVQRVRLAIEHRAADNILAVLSGGEPPDAINRPRAAAL
ncbi:MAG: NAD(P)-dependent oxidoreductase [Burkholderiales bacterium]